jgi:hypothetical protein
MNTDAEKYSFYAYSPPMAFRLCLTGSDTRFSCSKCLGRRDANADQP